MHFHHMYGAVVKHHKLYRVSQKKQKGGFVVLCFQKEDSVSTSLGKASSTKKNDTKSTEFGEVI